MCKSYAMRDLVHTTCNFGLGAHPPAAEGLHRTIWVLALIYQIVSLLQTYQLWLFPEPPQSLAS